MILNHKQSMIVKDIIHWYKFSNDQVYEFAGLAGTGKSTIFDIIIKELNLDRNRIAPMAFIGQAALVMRSKGMHNAKTIHSWLYEPASLPVYDDNGRHIIDEYTNLPKYHIRFIPRDLKNIDLMIIDEAFTVPYSMKRDIESRGIKIIAAGDPGQLPPVKDKPAYLNNLNDIIVLDEIVRQDAYSNILFLANRARNGIYISNGYYGDALVINRDQLNDEMILNSDIILCGTNKTRDDVNNRVRLLRGFNNILPSYGETMVCRKNNWNIESSGINLTNGLTGTIINDPKTDSFKDNMYTVSFSPNINGNKTSTCFTDLLCDYNYLIADREAKIDIKNNKFSKGEKFEFGYAITTHMSQGSQYRQGIYIEENTFLPTSRNLNYVGITRFTDKLIYVKNN